MSEMTDSAPVIASHIKIGKDGRRLTPQSLAGMKKGTEAGVRALLAYHAARKAASVSMEPMQPDDVALKPLALPSTPRILQRWIKGALGKLKGWPAASQIEAGKLVFAVAGIALEARAGAGGPLAEMTLAELQESLSATLESVQKIAAIEGQVSQVTDSTTSATPLLGVPDESAPVEPGPADVADQAPPPGVEPD